METNGDCMETVWRLYGDCMETAWRLHGDCMETAWGLQAYVNTDASPADLAI